MIGQILTSIRSVDKANVAKSGGVAVILGAGLNAAMLAGVAIPAWGQIVAPIVGVVIYKLLPKKEEAEVDALVDRVIDVATEIPQTYSAPTDYPDAPPETTPTNINKG